MFDVLIMADQKRYKQYLDKGSTAPIPRSTLWRARKRRLNSQGEGTSSEGFSSEGTSSEPIPSKLHGMDEELVTETVLKSHRSSPCHHLSDDITNDSGNELITKSAFCCYLQEEHPMNMDRYFSAIDSDTDRYSSDENSSDDENPHAPPDNPPDDENPPADPHINEPPNDPAPDDYGLDEPVMPNIQLSKFEILIMIIHFVIRFALSDVALEALLTLVNKILGVEIIPPTKYHFFKIFAHQKRVDVHLYCSVCLLYFGKTENCADLEVCPAEGCQASVDVKTLNKGNFFMTISIADQIKERLLQEGGEDLLNYRQNRNADPETISDVFDGLEFQELEVKVADKSDSFLTISCSTDGAEIFNSSIFSSVWPMQFYLNEINPKERFAAYNILLSGVWFGLKEPSMTTYMTPLIEELQNLANQGISWFRQFTGRLEVTKIYCLNFSADAPAKAKVLNMTQFNGYQACYMCTYQGNPWGTTQVRCGHRDVYPLRTENSVRQDMQEARRTGEDVNGMKGVSPLYHLPHFKLPWAVVIGYMHGQLLGVCKYLFSHLWTNSELHESPFYLNSAKMDIINSRVRALHPPSKISRDLRPLSAYAVLKANEWRSWLFYYGPICLRDVLPLPYYRHFCLLSSAVYFFNQKSIKRRDIAYHADLLSSFVEQFQQLYGPGFMVWNVHMTVHLPVCVTSNGPAWAYSEFPYETGISYIGRLIKGAKGVSKQLTRRYCTYSSIPSIVALHPPLNPIVTDYCDSILSTRRYKIADASDGGNIVIVGNKFRNKIVPTPEEVNAMIQAVPNIDLNSIYAIKKVIIGGCVYTSANQKEKRRDDSYVKLTDGKILQVKLFFISSTDFDKLFILGRELFFDENGGQRVFNLPHFHIRVCLPYPFANELIVMPASMIAEVCFFMRVANDAFLASFPNNFERD